MGIEYYRDHRTLVSVRIDAVMNGIRDALARWRNSSMAVLRGGQDFVNLTIMVVATTPEDERDFGVEGGR